MSYLKNIFGSQADKDDNFKIGEIKWRLGLTDRYSNISNEKVYLTREIVNTLFNNLSLLNNFLYNFDFNLIENLTEYKDDFNYSNGNIIQPFMVEKYKNSSKNTPDLLIQTSEGEGTLQDKIDVTYINFDYLEGYKSLKDYFTFLKLGTVILSDDNIELSEEDQKYIVPLDSPDDDKDSVLIPITDTDNELYKRLKNSNLFISEEYNGLLIKSFRDVFLRPSNEERLSLSPSVFPAHTHEFKTTESGDHRHTYDYNRGDDYNGYGGFIPGYKYLPKSEGRSGNRTNIKTVPHTHEVKQRYSLLGGNFRKFKEDKYGYGDTEPENKAVCAYLVIKEYEY